MTTSNEPLKDRRLLIAKMSPESLAKFEDQRDAAAERFVMPVSVVRPRA